MAFIHFRLILRDPPSLVKLHMSKLSTLTIFLFIYLSIYYLYYYFQEKMESIFRKGEQTDSWIPVDVSFIKEFWLPDAEILNLKEFKTLDVLSKLEGLSS